ncbi:DUF3310 domain-containing protein [Jeotgalibaca porci]|uniref:DUF3310 domain-containing protein n=1 Tax=Jeotgalibaca porci TaxID=1868793 RepID=UPI0035A1BFEB
MKKDIEWLKEEVQQIQNDGFYFRDNYSKYDQFVNVEDLIPLIDQLDEPEKQVIPQFVPEVADKTERVHVDKDRVEITVGEITSISFEDAMGLVENDMINQPPHYVGKQGLEVEAVLQNFIPRYEDPYVGHRVASAIEYLLRSPLKNQRQDIEKAGKNIQQALAYLDMTEEEK